VKKKSVISIPVRVLPSRSLQNDRVSYLGTDSFDFRPRVIEPEPATGHPTFPRAGSSTICDESIMIVLTIVIAETGTGGSQGQPGRTEED
jgi:hypothetical protein